MFGRKKKDQAAAPVAPPQPTIVDPQAKKGRPTPKRKDAEARNRTPLIQSDPRQAKAAAKTAAREERELQNQALMTGDEKHLPAAHKGPVRRYIRDAIDSRFMLGEYFFPITIIIIISLFLAQNFKPELAMTVIVGLYAIVLVALANSIWVSFQIKKELTAKFGSVRGTHMYAIARSMQMRRMRLPKPQIKRGEHPS